MIVLKKKRFPTLGKINQPGMDEAVLLGHDIYMDRNTAWLGNRHIITI